MILYETVPITTGRKITVELEINEFSTYQACNKHRPNKNPNKSGREREPATIRRK